MISRSTVATVATAAAVALGASALPAGAATTLKVTSCLARNHDYTEAFMATFLDPLNAKKADVTLNYLGGPEVTPWKKQGPSLKRGLVDVITCPAAYYGGLLPEARLPGLQNRSLEELRANGAMAMLEEAWNKGMNAHILAWVHFTGQKFFLHTMFEPTISDKTGLDLSGRKMRTTGLYRALLVAMGAAPVNIAPSDVYSALERGVVEGVPWPWGSIAKYGWQRFLKYRIEPGFYGATLMTIVNRDTWNKLTKAQQDLLEAQARIYEKESDAIIIKKAHEDDAKLKAAGIETIELTGAARKAYLNTIYGAKWAENDQFKGKYIVDYEKLKSLMYAPTS